MQLLAPKRRVALYEVLILGIATTKERWILLAKQFQENVNKDKPWIIIDIETYRGTSNKLSYHCTRHDFNGIASGAAIKKSKGCPQCQSEDHLYKTVEFSEVVRQREAVKFIDKATKLHGTKYTYHVDWYASKDDALTKIWCNTHQEFFYQRPAAHLQGQNCPKCGKESGKKNMTLDQHEVLERIRSHVTNDNISYENFVYSGQHSKSDFICKRHGQFTKSVSNIWHGDTLLCPTCIKENRLSLEESKFISDAKLIHGNKYDYSLVKGMYIDNRTNVPIICNTHNTTFYSSRNKHVDCRSGCPECAKLLLGRWNVAALKKNLSYHANKPCCTYLLRISHLDTVFYKLGITTDIRVRIKLISDELPDSEIEILQESWSNTIECVILEKLLLRQVKNNRYIHDVKFGGYTECFIPNQEQLLVLSTILSSPV